MIIQRRSRSRSLPCLSYVAVAIALLFGTQVSVGQSIDNQVIHPTVLPQITVEAPTGFAPPKQATQRAYGSHGIETEFGSGLKPVVPRYTLPGQIGNYVSPIQETEGDASPTNVDRSHLADGKRQVETSQRLELIVENYPNGSPRVKRQVTQDLEGNYFNHGLWQLMGKQQEITAQGEFYLGRMNGEWKRLHNKTEGGLFETAPFNKFEGPYRSYAEFTDGKLDGVWKITDRYEQTIFEMPYLEGKRHGTATWYHTNGIKSREVVFHNGELDGPLYEWDMQEKVTREEEYVKGRKIVKETQYFSPKQPMSQNFFLDSKLELSGEDNWWEAKPANYLTVGQRIQHGPTGIWYQNRQPQMQGQFQDGKREGVFIGWHSNGQKDVTGQFRNDLRVGKWTWWHSNGFKRVEGEFSDGVQIGEWIWWNEDGTVRNRRTMKQDKPLSETSGSETKVDENPSDVIIDDHSRGSSDPEEVEVQELPAKPGKQTDGESAGDGAIPSDVIPFDKDAQTKTDEESNSSPGLENAEEVESTPVEIEGS